MVREEKRKVRSGNQKGRAREEKRRVRKSLKVG